MRTQYLHETYAASVTRMQTLSGEASDRSRAPPHSPKMFMASDWSLVSIYYLSEVFFIVSKKYTCIYLICLDIIVWYTILMKKSRVVTKIFLSSVMTRFHQQLFEHYEYLMIIKVSRPQSTVITSLWISGGYTLWRRDFWELFSAKRLKLMT